LMGGRANSSVLPSFYRLSLKTSEALRIRKRKGDNAGRLGTW
jgi:hypothetical protein